MSEGNYVIRVITRLMTARLLYRVLVAVSVIFISNYLIADAKLADNFDLANSIVSIIMIGSEVGMSMVLMRSGAQHSHAELEKHYGTALLIETVACIVLSVIVLGGYALVGGFTTMFWLLLILGINQAVIQFRVPIRSIYRSLHSHEKITYIEVLDGLSKLIGIYYITQTVSNLTVGAYTIAIWYTATTILFIAIYCAYSFKLAWPRFEAKLISPLLKEGVWFAMQALIMTVYFEIDKWVLKFYQLTGWANIADGDIARYGAASRVIVFFLIFHRIGLQVITPYLYATYPGQLERYRNIVQWSTRYMSAAGIFLGMLVMVLASDIMHLLYKPAFWNAIPALILFGAFLIVRFIGITSSQIFATTGQQPKRTRQEGLAVVANVVLDLLLMPVFSFIGGAIASLITEAASQGFFYVMTRRLVQAPIWRTLADITPALLAGAITGGLVWASRGLWAQFTLSKPALAGIMLITAAGAAIVYAALLYLLRFFKPADFKLLKKSSIQPTPLQI